MTNDSITGDMKYSSTRLEYIVPSVMLLEYLHCRYCCDSSNKILFFVIQGMAAELGLKSVLTEFDFLTGPNRALSIRPSYLT
jgi:hypothetical protein